MDDQLKMFMYIYIEREKYFDSFITTDTYYEYKQKIEGKLKLMYNDMMKEIKTFKINE